jgi:hypothetical protein
MDRMTMGFFSDSVRNPENPVHPVQSSFPGLAGEQEGCRILFWWNGGFLSKAATGSESWR